MNQPSRFNSELIFSIAIGIIITAIIIFLIHTCRENDKLRKQTKALIDNRTIQEERLQTYRDNLGRERAKVRTLVTTIQGNEALLQAKDEQLQRITTDYNIKIKNLKAAVSLSQVAEAQVNLPVKDSLSGDDSVKVFKYKDEWLSIRGVLKGDSAVVQPVFRNDMDIIFHSERIKKRHVLDFFPPKQITAEVINSSPYVTTKSLKAKYTEPGKKWSERRGVAFAVGVLSGIVIVNQLK